MSSFLLSAKHLLKFNLNNGLKVTKVVSIPKPFGIRFLFTEEVLGVNGYLQTRERIITQFGNMRDKFFARMDDYTKSESKMVFTEDLKNIIFLAQNNEQEIGLLTDAIKKFHSQNQSLQFGTFVFGPLVMRLLHHLSEWDLALKLFKDPELKGFFGQIKSSVILMNLLFINGRYQECMDVLHFIQSEVQFDSKYPRDCVLLYTAAAYKLNNSQSFDNTLELLKKAREAGSPISRKTVCLFAALALNQNQPNVALEVLSLVTQTNYISVRNLRLMALTELERFDDLFIAIRLVLSRDTPPEGKRQEILKQTLNEIKEKVESKDDKQLQTEFSQIENALVEGNHISPNSLDSILLTPVVLREDNNQQFRDREGFRQQRGYVNPRLQQNYRRAPNRGSNEEF